MLQERYTAGVHPCFPCWAPAPLPRPTIHQISRLHLLSLIKTGSPSVQPSAPLMCACHIKFSSHKAISRLLPLSRCLCVNLQPASASLRSLQSCRLHCVLNELEARFLLNFIVFGLSIFASVILLVSTNSKGSLKGRPKASTIHRLHFSTLHLLHSSPKKSSRQSSKTKQECLQNPYLAKLPPYSRCLILCGSPPSHTWVGFNDILQDD